MKIYIGNTAWQWFDFLRTRNAGEEANFWQPGGQRDFSALTEGEVFLFRLKSPINKIAGGGVFLSGSRLPLATAWEAFGEKNGVESLEALRAVIAQYRREPSVYDDTPIGCVVLLDPVFLPEDDWIPTHPRRSGIVLHCATRHSETWTKTPISRCASPAHSPKRSTAPRLTAARRARPSCARRSPRTSQLRPARRRARSSHRSSRACGRPHRT